ncbi:MAG TPA: hypothetical protein VEU29_01015 [Actinomycetota bacterium]|nr:hypothetical protein [Actinomycetota bacterium]
MIFTIGSSDARVETQDTSSADVNTRFGEARVVRTYPAGTTPPANPPPDLAYVTGATSIMHGPPYEFRAVDDVRTTIQDVANPDQPMALQGRIYQHENYGMKVDVSNELPQAEGGFRTPTGATGELEWYLNNTQRDPSSTGPMHMDTGQPILWGMKYSTTTGSSSLNGTTKVNTGALGSSGRRVQSSASFRLPWMYFPRIYAGRNGSDSFSMLTLYDFVGNVNCSSTASPATATATGSWSFSFQYYYDPSNNGRTTTALGQGTVNSNGNDVLNGASVPDALAALKAQNPLIWDGSATNGCCTATSDTYMFDVRTGSNATSFRGYISDWSSNKNVETSVSADGRVTSASINGAFRFEMAGLRQTLTPELPQTGFSVSMGKLSCNAVDNR